MKQTLENETQVYKQIILICILIGTGVTLFFVFTIHEERFSSVYMTPESYAINSQGTGYTNFIYGIKSFEKAPMQYSVEFRVNNDILDHNQLELKPGETFEEKRNLKITSATFPAKVSVIVNTSYNTYEVHYWLKTPA